MNLENVNHGGPKDAVRHTGDLGNLNVLTTGDHTVRISDSVSSLTKVLGKSIVVHEGEDDLGKGTGAAAAGSLATGNAGNRLACCVIKAIPASDRPAEADCRKPIATGDATTRPKCKTGLCCAKVTPGSASKEKGFMEICLPEGALTKYNYLATQDGTADSWVAKCIEGAKKIGATGAAIAATLYMMN